MKTILLDVDGVLVNLCDPVHRAAEGILARPLPPPGSWQTHIFPVAMDMSSTETELFERALLFDDDLGFKVDLYPGAEQFVNELTRKYDVCFVTAPWPRMRHWVYARENLLQSYFPDIDVVHTRHKFRVNGDILIDDHVDNVMLAQSKGVIFDRPWNYGFKAPRRALNYEHALQMLEIW